MKITYDFSYFFRDYLFATSCEATFPGGSLTRAGIPLLFAVNNVPNDDVPVFEDSTCDVLGRYINFLDGNDIVEGKSIILEIPRSQVVSATDYVVYQYNKDQNRWIEIADSAIIEKSDSSNVIVLTSTEPLIFTGKRNPLSSTTLYFG